MQAVSVSLRSAGGSALAEQLAKAQDRQYYGFAGWMKAQGLTSESLGTSMSIR